MRAATVNAAAPSKANRFMMSLLCTGQPYHNSARSSSAEGMLLIVAAQPVHAVVVLRVAHDGVDVIGLLDREFDDQPRTMDPIVERVAEIVGRTTPREVQLLEAGLLNGLEMPLGSVMIGIADVFLDQGDEQLLL